MIRGHDGKLLTGFVLICGNIENNKVKISVHQLENEFDLFIKIYCIEITNKNNPNIS